MLPKDHKYDDLATYALLASGATTGVFQLESDGMIRTLKRIKPRNLQDIAAIISLYRPGPMSAGAHELYAKRKAEAEAASGKYFSEEWRIHPELSSLDEVLADTYGLIVFQEDVLQVLNIVCGWTYSEAELLFNAMRKKDHSKMEAARPLFRVAGRSKGYSGAALDILWDTLVPFADYSFNKSHATGYALLSYETAYLKAHYPKEYMASLLSSVDDVPLIQYGKPSKKQNYINEVQRMGIRILGPDVNVSNGSWTPTEEGIRYGLSAIKGVGGKAFDALVSKRPYRDLDDFLMRTPKKVLNVGVMEALVKCGALDTLYPERESLSQELNLLVESALAKRTSGESGQTRIRNRNLVSKLPKVPRDYQYRRTGENEYLGLSVSAPLVQINVPLAFTPARWHWLKRTLDAARGDSAVILNISGQPVPYSGRIYLSEPLRSVLKDQGIEVEES